MTLDDDLHRRARKARRSRPELATREQLAELLELWIVGDMGREAFGETFREAFGVEHVGELTREAADEWLERLKLSLEREAGEA